MSETPTCWLTRAVITPRTLFARGIKDAYTWHQLVWQAFPGQMGNGVISSPAWMTSPAAPSYSWSHPLNRPAPIG